MVGKIRIKCLKGTLMDTYITTESGEPIPRVTDFKIEIREDRKLYAILTIKDPILEIETENCEVLNE